MSRPATVPLNPLPVPLGRAPARRFPAMGLLVALVVLFAAPPQARAQVVPTPENVVHLSVSASAEVPLDTLRIVFGARREGPEAATVQAQVAQALEAALVEARKAARAGAVDVRTGNFSLAPRYVPKGGTSGWVGSAELIVEGRDGEAIAALAGRLQTMSITATGWSLSVAQRDKTEEAMAAQAIADFRAKADRTARLFGFTGWLLREVTVGADGPPPGVPRMALAARAAGAAMEAPLPVEAGQASVGVTVQGSIQLTR